MQYNRSKKSNQSCEALHYVVVFQSQEHIGGLRGLAVLLYDCTVGTCKLFLAAVSYALLQILQLVPHLLVLSLRLLALPPAQMP